MIATVATVDEVWTAADVELVPDGAVVLAENGPLFLPDSSIESIDPLELAVT